MYGGLECEILHAFKIIIDSFLFLQGRTGKNELDCLLILTVETRGVLMILFLAFFSSDSDSFGFPCRNRFVRMAPEQTACRFLLGNKSASQIPLDIDVSVVYSIAEPESFGLGSSVQKSFFAAADRVLDADEAGFSIAAFLLRISAGRGKPYRIRQRLFSPADHRKEPGNERK